MRQPARVAETRAGAVHAAGAVAEPPRVAGSTALALRIGAAAASGATAATATRWFEGRAVGADPGWVRM